MLFNIQTPVGSSLNSYHQPKKPAEPDTKRRRTDIDHMDTSETSEEHTASEEDDESRPDESKSSCCITVINLVTI